MYRWLCGLPGKHGPPTMYHTLRENRLFISRSNHLPLLHQLGMGLHAYLPSSCWFLFLFFSLSLCRPFACCRNHCKSMWGIALWGPESLSPLCSFMCSDSKSFPLCFSAITSEAWEGRG